MTAIQEDILSGCIIKLINKFEIKDNFKQECNSKGESEAPITHSLPVENQMSDNHTSCLTGKMKTVQPMLGHRPTQFLNPGQVLARMQLKACADKYSVITAPNLGKSQQNCKLTGKLTLLIEKRPLYPGVTAL